MKKTFKEYVELEESVSLSKKVELKETIKKGDVFTKKEALAYFKKERKDFKPSELKKFKNKGSKVVMHWQDGETGEVVPMKESVELDEGVSLSKKGNYEVTVEGKTSVGIRISLRYKGKIIVYGTKVKGEFVMGFNPKQLHPNPRYKPADTDKVRMVKKGKEFTHLGFKKVDDIIDFANNLKIVKENFESGPATTFKEHIA